MRVFVTGGSGWVGSVVVPDLMQGGHQVVGLARSVESEAALQAAGAEVFRGSLEDLDALSEGAGKSDGVIHLAFIHDFSDYESANQIDRRAIETMGAALAGTDRPLLIASGVATTAHDRPATEDDPPLRDFPRSPASELTLALAGKGVRSAVVRLPPTVHGKGDKGFIPMIIDTARQKGVSAYIEEGWNRWPAVHRIDVARLYRVALEQAPPGSVWHAVADEGVATRALAELIGRHLDVPVASIPGEAAIEHFGAMIGLVWGLDLPCSSALTRNRLGWEPSQPGLLDDLEQGHYFQHA